MEGAGAQPIDAADWGALLDRLSQSISAEEELQVRKVAGETDIPDHLVVLHRHVAGLLVNYGISTWEQLRANFPDYHKEDDAADTGYLVPEDPFIGLSAPSPSKARKAKSGGELLPGGKRNWRVHGGGGGNPRRRKPEESFELTSKGKKRSDGPNSTSHAPTKRSQPQAPPKNASKQPPTCAVKSKNWKEFGISPDYIPVHVGVGKRRRSAYFNWKTMEIGLRDGSLIEPQEFCTLAGKKSPWRTTIFTEADSGTKELGCWLIERCSICQLPGNPEQLLLCDTKTCDTWCHTYCLTPKLASIPKGDWYCPQCEVDRG